MALAPLLSLLVKALSLIVICTLPLVLWQTHSQTERHPGSRPAGSAPRQYAEDLPACSAIVQGDMEGKKEELGQLLASTRRTLLSEEFYLNETRDCEAFVDAKGYITTPLSVEERDFPIAYSMVIHEKIEMFERLLRALYHPQNVYCVHVDRKSPEEFQKAVRAIVSCFPNVFVASTLERVVYASWSRVQADLNCMKDLWVSPVPWRYLINTCGTDFPIKTNAETVRHLKLLNGRNSMESEATSDHKKSRWQYSYNVTDVVRNTGVRKTPPPISGSMFSGNAYFVVTRDFVRHLQENTEVQNLLEWEKDTYSPDEHLWATLQRMPSVPGSNPAHVKYQESDMNAIARLVKWGSFAGDVNKGAAYPPCAGVYRRAVCVYGAGDLRWLFQHHHLMANKFDPTVDDIAIRCIESLLHFKAMHAPSTMALLLGNVNKDSNILI